MKFMLEILEKKQAREPISFQISPGPISLERERVGQRLEGLGFRFG